MNARHTITQLTCYIQTFTSWQLDGNSKQYVDTEHTPNRETRLTALLDTFRLPASTESSRVKNANRRASFRNQGRKPAICSLPLPIAHRRVEANVVHCMLGVSGAGTLCPQASPHRKAGAPSTHCRQKPASLPAVAQARALLQRARRRQDRPTPCAALSFRALGRGLWAGWSRGAAVCGREWRLGSRRRVLPT